MKASRSGFDLRIILFVIIVFGVLVGGSLWLVDRYLVSTHVTIPGEELEPYWPTKGWRKATPRDVGMNQAMLDEMLELIREQGVAVDSVLVIRNGYLVIDEYFPPFSKGEKHPVFSCTKSVVSTLIGIAIDEGYIERVDQRVLDFFPNRTIQNLSPWKDAMTLGNLLTMSAGFDARDSYLYGWERLRSMLESNDPVQYVLDLPVAEKPGTRFEYTNGVSHLLSAIVSETTGMSASRFAEEHLFTPLNITDFVWEGDPQGRNWGFSNLHLTPDDMAKLGYLFLNEGMWDDEQIVSQEWVEAATTSHIEATLVDGYGYQWWVDSEGYYQALGYNGQFIYVVADYNLVVVFTGSSAEDFDVPRYLLETYIILAVD